jgi:hypothetical protein
MDWKRFVRKRLCPNFEVLPYIHLEGAEKTTKNLSQNCRSPRRNLNTETFEYEARVQILAF